jgi:glucose/arabinose dehydrogenase
VFCVLLTLLLSGLVACTGGAAPPAGGRAPAPSSTPAAPAPPALAAPGETDNAVGPNGAASRDSSPPAAAVAQELGPLVATPLDVPARLRVDAFRQPHTLNLPQGWRAQLFAAGLAGPRLLAFDEQGVLHVTLTRAGAVVALPDRDQDGVADGVVAVREGLERPHGLAFRDGWLYIAETGRVVRLRGAAGGLERPTLESVVPELPAGGNHYTRTLGFGPDGGLYVSVGSSCNVCVEPDPRRAAILRFEADGSGGRIYARGLRNAVGFTWQPGTGALIATNNGRDMLGDDLPPETLNVVRDGDDFGWPRCHVGRLVDPDFGRADACSGVAAPRAEMQAHAAPLGLAFYPDAASVLVAQHGSWNRSVPVPPQLVRVVLRADGGSAVEPFASGWQLGGGEASRWGRPVDVAAGPDGAVYVSDDGAGAIYRLTPPP